MRRLAAAFCLLLLSPAAFAHRLDEYLQATILTLQPNRVQASMRLIPGVLVSKSVIAEIDTNSNGVFEPSEQQAYANRVLADLVLTLDGRTASPHLISVTIPPPAALRDGLGEIHIDYTVEIPPGGSLRSLILSNHHFPRRSIYLVNATVPEDHTLSILGQKRNPQQSVYELDYRRSPSALGSITRAVWFLLPLVFVSFLCRRLALSHSRNVFA